MSEYQTTVKTEYMIEALIVPRGKPEDEATWEQWAGPVDDVDDELFSKRLVFARERVELARSDLPQAPMRMLDFRVLVREIVTTPWKKTEVVVL